ncbi:uncharacterized protein LOC108627119 isoform X2 [Ceratina calcarata]|nr:uncharacterized protein LOC108627119 isoform X2 [Ceratina calcarata]
MNLSRDIQKIRQVPLPDDTALFVRRRDYNENRVFRKPKTPPNAQLLDFDTDPGNSRYNATSVPQEILQEDQIASAIDKVNGGINYSNEASERHWEKETSSVHNKEDLEKSNIAVNTKTNSELMMLGNSNSEENIQDQENILKQCKLHKNAVVRGLLKQQLIRINDLMLPSDTEIKSNRIQTASPSTKPKTQFVQLVPCPEDPDVLIQPLQAYGRIDETKYKDIDFTVPRVGTKKTVTPRKYYTNLNDSDFEFVKHSKK